MSSPEINLGVVGATGPVGQTILEILPDYDFDIGELRLFASEASEGKSVELGGEEFTLRHAKGAEDFHGLDAVIVAAGGDATKTAVSKLVQPWITEAGAVDIDKSSVFRHAEGVPLVLAGVNDHELKDVKRGDIVASPNCTTSIGLQALKPLHDAAGLKSLNAHTYQSVSGQGQAGIDGAFAEAEELMAEGPDDLVSGKIRGRHPLWSDIFPVATPALNVVPFAGSELQGGTTTEEQKFVKETRRILGEDELPVMATCARTFVMNGHSIAISAEFENDISPEEAENVLADAPGIRLVETPHALAAVGLDDVLVGRIRRDVTRDNGLEFWAVGDNLRPGAATNGLRIVEIIANQGL